MNLAIEKPEMHSRRAFVYLWPYVSLELCLGLLHVSLRAQAPATSHDTRRTKFSYADLLMLRSVENVEISPDGKLIAYVVSVDPMKDRQVQTVWVVRLADKQTVQVDLSNTSAPTWTPDDRHLLVVSQSEDGKSSIALLQTD